MKESISSYVKIIVFGIKNRKILEFIDLQYQKFSERWKLKRKNEYTRRSVRMEQALEKIFPGKTIDTSQLSELEKHLDNFIQQKKLENYPSINVPYKIGYGINRNIGKLLFSICYFSQPEIIVETGVAYGFSCAYILHGLDFINKGKLVSVDCLIMPWHTKDTIGSVIPDHLKKRHTLLIENTPPNLKKLLNKMNSIDIFIHDSSHTYKHMMNEFRIAWPHIKKGGLLLADDIQDNDAFLDFADLVSRDPIIIKLEERKRYHFGIIQK